MSLLAHRGSLRRRSKSGFVQQLASIARGFVAKKGSVLPSRAPTANLGLVAAVAVCLGVGYVLGNTFPWSRNQGQDGLRVTAGEEHAPRSGVAPGPLGEPEDMRPLAGQFFLTAAYEQIEPAGAAARTLRQGGLGKARLRQLPLGDKTYFGLVVYCDGDREREATRTALLQVTAPDEGFDHYRKTQKGWPLLQEVR